MEGVGFEAWYRAEHPRVLGIVAALTGRRDLAVEATDEAFVRAWARWSRVSKMDSPGAWTVKVALNVARRAYRHATREHVPAVEPEPVPATDTGLWEPVRALPLQQRTAIVLRHVGGFSHAEIASAMGVREGTVGSTLNAAHKKLRGLLAAPEEEAGVNG
jgi:RNA polymerase sigma-70 factor (ECF subfamily)